MPFADNPPTTPPPGAVGGADTGGDLGALPLARTSSRFRETRPRRNTHFSSLSIFDETDEESGDVAGLATFENSLGAKGRLAYRLHIFHFALRTYFSYMIGAGAFVDIKKAFYKLQGKEENSRWENEFVGLQRDIRDLSSPDFEIGGRRKLNTATRMRTSYKCLVVNGNE